MDISAATEVSPAPRLRVLLVQLPVPNNPPTNVPLAAGYLKAYAQAQGLLEQVDVDILPRALADHAGDALLVEEIVARQPDMLGLSLYTWNSECSLDVAARACAAARPAGGRRRAGGAARQRLGAAPRSRRLCSKSRTFASSDRARDRAAG